MTSVEVLSGRLELDVGYSYHHLTSWDSTGANGVVHDRQPQSVSRAFSIGLHGLSLMEQILTLNMSVMRIKI